MPLKLNVGLSKKVGEQNYGSRGASVHVEMELDASTFSEPQRLQERIRQLFNIARSSVADELNRKCWSSNASSNGHSGERQSNQVPPATRSQVKALFAIAKSNGLDINSIVQDRFRVSRPDDLSIKEASALIDDLKSGR